MMHWFPATLVVLVVAVVWAHALPGHSYRSEKIDPDLLREIEALLERELGQLEGEKRGEQPDEPQEKKKERREYSEPPPGWTSGQTAARTLRTLSRVNANVRQDMVNRIKKEEQFLNELSGDKELMRRVVELNLDSRADPHFSCHTSLDCSDRVFIADVSGNNKEYRKANGSCNNLANPWWGSSHVQHRRLQGPFYPNNKWGIQTRGVNREDLPNPRKVSNTVMNAAATSPTNTQGVSLQFFQFLQFLDHDIAATIEGTSNKNCCNPNNKGFCMPLFVTEADDPVFPENYCMDARRSFTYKLLCSGGDETTRDLQNQVNAITAYVDASNVYGSTQEEQDALRMFHAGELIIRNNFPPVDETKSACSEDNTEGNYCIKVGDSRGSVFVTLSAIHTLFLRHHNRIAGYFASNTNWNDEKIFQVTKKIVTAMMQRIVYEEALPILLDSGMAEEHGVSTDYSYDDSVDASLFSAFFIAFRVGHTMIPESLTVDDGTTATTWNSKLLYTKPSFLLDDNYRKIDQLQDNVDKTLMKQPDNTIVSAARNFLFFDGEYGFDLGALNIQRSREWGTGFYWTYKSYCGIGETEDWDSFIDTHTEDMIELLKAAGYLHPKDVDLYAGIVTETKVGTSFLGKVGSCLIGKQFGFLKHGDRFWYEATDSSIGFNTDQLTEIEKSSFAAIVCLNSDVATIPEESFKQTSTEINCSEFEDDAARKMDLSKFLNE